MDGGGVALFSLVRFWSRRWAQVPHGDWAVGEGHVPYIMVLEAIASVGPDAEASISTVAGQLGVDHSVASRMVAQAVAEGYVRKEASARDARRSVLRTSTSGDELLAAARAWQEEVFGELTAGWAPEDADQFAGYLRRLAEQVGASNRSQDRE